MAPLVQGCPAASVHTSGDTALFATAAHLPEALFVDATSPATEFLTFGSSRCPVLGWAEHLDYAKVSSVSDEELLVSLKIDAPVSEADIRRHSTGFVVTRRDSPTGEW